MCPFGCGQVSDLEMNNVNDRPVLQLEVCFRYPGLITIPLYNKVFLSTQRVCFQHITAPKALLTSLLSTSYIH